MNQTFCQIAAVLLKKQTSLERNSMNSMIKKQACVRPLTANGRGLINIVPVVMSCTSDVWRINLGIVHHASTHTHMTF